MRKIIIAIDGHAGCGKSTTAKVLAKKLSYIFIDSGAMYRALTLFLLDNNISITNTSEVIHSLNNIDIQFEYNTTNTENEVLLNKVPVSHQIRTMAVNQNVSAVSAIKEVREFLVAKQQEIGKEKGIVMDGRDIGTVVFPDAELKIFMTASLEARTQRRITELGQKGIEADGNEVMKNLEERDIKDSTRKESPLKQADDAIVIDTSTLTIDEQVDKVLKLALNTINSST